MRDSNYRITLDMHDIASQVQITAKKNDTSRKLFVTLMENGSPYTIESGCRAIVLIARPGSTTIVDECEIRLSDSVIMYDFNSNTANCVGINECEIRLIGSDDEVITSPRFTMLVNENVYEDGQVHGIKHSEIIYRNDPDQHQISSISGLSDALASKANNSDINELESEIAFERNRIDNITKTPGGTTGDAELIDARIGADGTTYTNLGTAIRTQFNNVSGKLNAANSFTDSGEYTLETLKLTRTTTLGIVPTYIFVPNVMLDKGFTKEITLRCGGSITAVTVYLLRKTDTAMEALSKERFTFSGANQEKTFPFYHCIEEDDIYIGLAEGAVYTTTPDNAQYSCNFFAISGLINVGESASYSTDRNVNKQFGVALNTIVYTKSVIDHNEKYFMLNNILCIGDSLTNGSDGANQLSTTYPFYLKKISNAELVNKVAQNGATVMTIVYNYLYDESKMLWTNNYDTIFIMLGTNGYLTDTIDQPETPDENPNCRGYISLITKCRQEAPNAQIFLICPPYAANLDVSKLEESGNVVKKLGKKFNLPVIDPFHDLPMKGRLYHPNDYTHFNKYGYFNLAKFITDKVNEYYSKIYI